jgi:hypothetical protein
VTDQVEQPVHVVDLEGDPPLHSGGGHRLVDDVAGDPAGGEVDERLAGQIA